MNLSSADLPVSQTPVLQTGGRRGTRRLAEGEGVEPSTVRSARFSGPVACRHAPPSELVVPARLERATPAFGQRCSAPLSYGTKDHLARGRRPRANWSGWLDSNQRPPASEAGTLAGLSYTLLALRREIESLSPDRQSGRLTRCVTEHEHGASGPTRTATECALNALPLPIGVQTRRVAKIGGPGRIRTCGGLEPSD